MNSDTLAELIRERGYAAVIEVTNGLHIDSFSDKVREAGSGKAHLKRILRECQARSINEEKTCVEAGVIFFKHEDAVNNTKNELDFLYQLKSLKQQRAATALEAITSDNTAPKLTRCWAERILALAETGIALDRIFYPSPADIEEFSKVIPDLPTNPDEYQSTISRAKGRMLEEYIAKLCTHIIPDAKTEYIMRHVYTRDERTLDIDLIIIGDKDVIKKSLLNSHDLREIPINKRVKDAPRRYAQQEKDELPKRYAPHLVSRLR